MSISLFGFQRTIDTPRTTIEPLLTFHPAARGRSAEVLKLQAVRRSIGPANVRVQMTRILRVTARRIALGLTGKTNTLATTISRQRATGTGAQRPLVKIELDTPSRRAIPRAVALGRIGKSSLLTFKNSNKNPENIAVTVRIITHSRAKCKLKMRQSAGKIQINFRALNKNARVDTQDFKENKTKTTTTTARELVGSAGD